MKKKTGVYCRVSTEAQESEGTSLGTQLEACLKYCLEKGYEVTHRFIESYSGLSLERPKLNELRDLVRNNQIDVLVVFCLDRLTRDPGHGVIITQELEKHNVKLEAAIEDVDNTELGKLIVYVKGFAAKLEAEKIRERSMRGKRARALAGRLPSGTGHKLYGYDYLKGKGIGEGIRYVNLKESELVQEMFKWFVEEGMTVNGITRRLRAMEIPTPSGSKFWIRQTVYRMLTNPAYSGKTYAFTKTYIEPKRRLKSNATTRKTGVVWRPKDQWVLIPNATPAIISEKMFEDAQALLKRNKQLACRNAKRQYLLSGYIFCQRCGVRYQGYLQKWQDYGKKYEQRYYRCSKSQSIVSPIKCTNCRLHAPSIEKMVWEKIEELLSQPDTILEAIRDKEKEAGNLKSLEREKELIQNRFQHLDKAKERIYRAYYLTGDEEVFKTGITELTTQFNTLQQSKAEIEGKLESTKDYKLEIEGIKKACELVKNKLQNITYEDKRLALAALQIKVLVDGSNIQITGTIPLQPQPIESSATR
jgi:site-specific DNA recombinase